ncbi:MAG: MFS transporter [Anaerolineales bacterium]|nr:MFS transporter [Anaerolineales bacterium]
MKNILPNIRKLYNEFPRLFWIVVLARFIDALGGTILFPFFSLYVTQRFGVGMTEAGILLGINSFFALGGSMVGGALADKFGRRKLILFGLVLSGLSSLSLGLADSIQIMYPLVIVVGLLSSMANPAHEAMLADILPEAKRQEGYGILRVVFNYAWIFGTAMGGFIAARSFFALFVIDAVVSCIVAALLFRLLPETKPKGMEEAAHREESFWETVKGYRVVLRDLAFVGFIASGMLALIVYIQQYGSFAVYLRDTHGIDSKGYGVILSITGLEVVLFQFWISRLIRYRPPFLMMMLGAVIFAAGVFLYGIVSGFMMFVIAAVIVCLGEMLYFPTSQVLAAGFAPKEMRGRYMALAGFSWSVPNALGPGAAGYILDHFDPRLLWYIGGFLCLLSALGYFALHLKLGTQERFTPAPPEKEQEPAAA